MNWASVFDIFVIDLKIVESLYSKSSFCNINLKTSSSTIHISCGCWDSCSCADDSFFFSSNLSSVVVSDSEPDGVVCGLTSSSSSLDSISMLSIGSSLLVFSDFLASASET